MKITQQQKHRMAGALAMFFAALPHSVLASGFLESYKAAQAAHAAGEFQNATRRLEAALLERPDHPAALYLKARVAALGGATEQSIAALESLAEMRLSFDPANEADFRGLKANAGFQKLLKAFERNGQPVGAPSIAFRIFMPTLFPEGIAYDPDSANYFVGGVHERRILQSGRGGTQRTSDFVRAGGGGLMAPLGMVVESRRDRLWVAHAGLPAMVSPDPDDLGRSGIIGYDLPGGRARSRGLLPNDGRKHELRHLLLQRDGSLLASDAAAGQLWQFSPVSGKFTALTAPGALISARGMAADRDAKIVYVADFARGIYAFTPASGKLELLTVGKGISVYGIDGLYFHEGDLIAVQTGVRPHRVVRLKLSESGQEIESAVVLVANQPEFDTPGQAVIVGNRFNFIANTQRDRLNADGTLPPEEQLRSPVVFRFSLD